MDKQEAIDFVLDELDKGHSLTDITSTLSLKLGAPPEVVGKFVTQTAERYQQSKAALKIPAPTSQIPSAFSALPKAPPPPVIASTALPPQPVRPEPIPEPNPVYQPPVVPAALSASQLSPAADPASASQASAQVGKEAVSPELEKFILDQLGKNKKVSDVILMVVERTGMEYRAAQRLVSRVGARNAKKVAARQNCVIIPLALVFLIAGFVLLGASVVEAYQIRFMLPSPNDLNIEQVQTIYDRGRSLPWAFATGLALAVGGGIGLFTAIRNQAQA